MVTSPSRLLLRLHGFGLPVAVLLALLQRTPVLRLLSAAPAVPGAAPAAQLVRSVLTAAALGAVHSLAGATTFVATQGRTTIVRTSTSAGSPTIRDNAVGTAGTAITAVSFTYSGTPSLPQYFSVSGRLPDGLAFVPALRNGVVNSGTPVISGTPTVGGSFTVYVQGYGTAGNGLPESITFQIAGGAAGTAPSFTTQPLAQTATVGGSVTFTAEAAGSPAPTYQWRRNGVNLAGATTASLTLNSVQTTDAGTYSVVATNSVGNATSAGVALTVQAAESTARLSNLSVRTPLALGQRLIVGVVVSGGSRDILVRAAGPALAAFGLSSAMVDPRLELYRSDATLVLSNDNWASGLAPTFASVGAFAFSAGSRDAAFVQTLSAPHSIQALGTGPGIVLVEAYDTGAPTAAKLVNVSARNQVGTGDDILIAGFAISGTGNKPLLFRAVGPGLAAFGVPGTLVDPKLEIYNSTGVKVAENDNWDPALAVDFGAVGAFALPANSRDAALRTSLPPGSYTAQVRGADGGTGEALIEIYEAK